jgi:hypothetical protein
MSFLPALPSPLIDLQNGCGAIIASSSGHVNRKRRSVCRRLASPRLVEN